MCQAPGFLFVTCQVGAEGAVKREMARGWPELRFSFSRPGFLTFKMPAGHTLTKDLQLNLVFARAAGYSLGSIGGTNADELAKKFWQLADRVAFRWVHVFSRDRRAPGDHDFEPGLGPADQDALAALQRHRPGDADGVATAHVPRWNEPAGRGGRVLDCILVEPDQWWVGLHRANSMAARWPGGMPSIRLPESAVSRAYLKMAEALDWAQLPVRAGEQCVELGAAPGGASQALLERGLEVLGVDPADSHPSVLAHPHFHHVRARAADLKRRALASARWLTADMNIVPTETLKAVEALVTHPRVHIRGLILTLKLSQWKLAEQVPQWIETVRSWGYGDVRVRQLTYNRREVCLAALRRRALRRLAHRPAKRKRSAGPQR